MILAVFPIIVSICKFLQGGPEDIEEQSEPEPGPGPIQSGFCLYGKFLSVVEISDEPYERDDEGDDVQSDT